MDEVEDQRTSPEQTVPLTDDYSYRRLWWLLLLISVDQPNLGRNWVQHNIGKLLITVVIFLIAIKTLSHYKFLTWWQKITLHGYPQYPAMRKQY